MTRRALSIVLVAVLIFVATRATIRALPGDPLDTLIAESGTSLPRELLRKELGLDRPFLSSVAEDISRALHGDLGISLTSRQPIAPMLVSRWLKTVELASVSILLAMGFSLFLGLAAADPRTPLRRTADRVCTVYGAIVAAMPTPWIGPLLMIAFCVWIPVFPTGDHLLLPAMTLALSFTGFWSRLVRERVQESLREGHATVARARGLPEWKITWKHGLAPASGALLAYLGTQAGALMAGAFVTEVVFDWRGMGSLLVEAVLRRDYPVVESATFLAAIACLGGTALGDWAQTRVDPRL